MWQSIYKIVKVNGVQTDRIKINKSTYKGSDRVVTYGTAGDPTLSENLPGGHRSTGRGTGGRECSSG